MHLIVVDVQRFVKMPLSSLAGIFIAVVVVVIYMHIYNFSLLLLSFLLFLLG